MPVQKDLDRYKRSYRGNLINKGPGQFIAHRHRKEVEKNAQRTDGLRVLKSLKLMGHARRRGEENCIALLYHTLRRNRAPSYQIIKTSTATSFILGLSYVQLVQL